MINTEFQVYLAIIITRAIVLLIAALGGVLSIYLGYRLYILGVQSTVGGEATSGENLKAKLTATGPGVFFAAFGMGILIYLVLNPPQIETEQQHVTPTAADIQHPASLLQHVDLKKPPRTTPAGTCYLKRRFIKLDNGDDLEPDAARASLERGAQCLKDRLHTLKDAEAISATNGDIEALHLIAEATQ